MVEEITPDEQLMGLVSEPPVPESLRFVFKGLIWPDQRRVQKTPANPTREVYEAREETLEWLARVLKPEWIAPDLRERLLVATTAANGQDAFLARYNTGGTKIQILVNRVFVYLVVAPAYGFARSTVRAAIHELLRVNDVEGSFPWTGEPWSIVAAEGLMFGYQPRSFVADWRESLSYLTNGRGVKFSIKKVDTYSHDYREAPKTICLPTDESERYWFDKGEA